MGSTAINWGLLISFKIFLFSLSIYVFCWLNIVFIIMIFLLEINKLFHSGRFIVIWTKMKSIFWIYLRLILFLFLEFFLRFMATFVSLRFFKIVNLWLKRLKFRFNNSLWIGMTHFFMPIFMKFLWFS